MTSSRSEDSSQPHQSRPQAGAIYARAATYGVLLGLFLLILDPAAALVQPNVGSDPTVATNDAEELWNLAGAIRWEFAGLPLRMRHLTMNEAEITRWIDETEVESRQTVKGSSPSDRFSSELSRQFVDIVRRSLPVLREDSGRTVYGITHPGRIIRVAIADADNRATIESAVCAIRRPHGDREPGIGREDTPSDGSTSWVIFEFDSHSLETSTSRVDPLLPISDGAVVLQGRDQRDQVCAQLVLTGRSVLSLVRDWKASGRHATRLPESEHWAVAIDSTGEAPVFGVCPLQWGKTQSGAVLIQQLPAK